MSRRDRRPLPISDAGELLDALGRLDERDRSVLKMRYGLDGTRLHNLREIARVLGISRERVRQLEERAIERLGPGHSPLQAGATHPTPPTSRTSLMRRWTLTLLALRPAHVYELRKRLIELGIPPPSYRDLYDLESAGLVASAWVAGSGAGPNRRVYSLTSDGRAELKADRDLLEKTAVTLAAFLEKEPSDAPGTRSAVAREVLPGTSST
jgi:DNA-binding PadR family transcriptional regulator